MKYSEVLIKSLKRDIRRGYDALPELVKNRNISVPALLSMLSIEGIRDQIESNYFKFLSPLNKIVRMGKFDFDASFSLEEILNLLDNS